MNKTRRGWRRACKLFLLSVVNCGNESTLASPHRLFNSCKRSQRMSKPRLRSAVDILLSGNLSEDTRSVWDAIQSVNCPPQLFRSGSEIVWGTGIPVVVKPVNPIGLRRFVTDHVKFRKVKQVRGGASIQVPGNPTLELCQNMLAGPLPDFPRLRSVVRLPVFTEDGLINQRGYSHSGQLYFDPDPDVEIPEVPVEPTVDDIKFAKELLLEELLGDFPFKNEASKAHAFAAAILPFIRPLIQGPTPLHPIIKPKAGTGATLLARELARISCEPTLIVFPATESERHYTLFATIREMPRVVILDNVNELGGSTLASVLTATRFKSRVIRSSNAGEVDNQTTWLATGNNPNLSDELCRRSAPITLYAKHERPEDRTVFKHPDLPEWALDQRPWLIWASLTIIQLWFQAGRPHGRKTLGGFESWARIIGGITECVGIEGFLENLAEFRDHVDSKSRAIRNLVLDWADQFGSREVTASELLPITHELDLGSGEEKSRSIRLGKLLSRIEGQCYGAWVIKRGGFVNGYQYWRLERVEEGDVVDVGPVTLRK